MKTAARVAHHIDNLHAREKWKIKMNAQLSHYARTAKKIERKHVPMGFLAFYQSVCPNAHTLGVDIDRCVRAYMVALGEGDDHVAAQVLNEMGAEADALKRKEK